jgi:hypothetical protein
MFGLIGVFVGFVLAFGGQELKEWLQRRAMRAALLAELKSNLHMLPQKRAIVRQIIENLSARRLLPGDSVRFSTAIYEAHYPTLSWRYSDLERNSLHVIYEYFRTVDSTLAGYSDHIAESLQSERLNDIIGIQKAKMTDIANLLGVAEGLISKHLAGGPADVLYLAKDYKEIKDAQF